MRLARISFVIGLACMTGCTSGRLHQRTIDQGSTLPGLQYQQVLDNLAQFAENPAALPWHVNLREGTSQVTDSLSGGAALDIGPPVTWFPELIGSRTAVAQWGVSPVIDATELRLLRRRLSSGFEVCWIPTSSSQRTGWQEMKRWPDVRHW
jgi:hypothetical protein